MQVDSVPGAEGNVNMHVSDSSPIGRDTAENSGRLGHPGCAGPFWGWPGPRVCAGQAVQPSVPWGPGTSDRWPGSCVVLKSRISRQPQGQVPPTQEPSGGSDLPYTPLSGCPSTLWLLFSAQGPWRFWVGTGDFKGLPHPCQSVFRLGTSWASPGHVTGDQVPSEQRAVT